MDNRILGFDAIRAVSVLLVIASHVGLIGWASQTPAGDFFAIFNASFGVRAFFILSGFLITTILIQEYERYGTIDARLFMMKRALRILPLYFVVLLFLKPYFSNGHSDEATGTALYAVFFAYNFIPNELNVHYLSHLWSLGVEEQFYILWPLVFSFLAARRNVLIGLCFAIVAVCAWRMTFGFGPEAAGFSPNRWTIPAIYPIAMGAALALAIADKGLGAAVTRAVRSRPSLVAAAILITLPVTWDASDVTLEMAGAIGITLIVGWIYTNQDKAAVKALEWKPLAYLGSISYGLYMWQGILTGNGPYRELHHWPPEPWIGAILTFPVAALSYRYFERPILDLRKKLKRRRPMPIITAQSAVSDSQG